MILLSTIEIKSMRTVIIVCFQLLLAQPLIAAEQVPFEDAVSENIYNYHRHTPQIATSGELKPGALQELKRFGFKTVVDLRTASEGVKDEAESITQMGMDYHNIPIGRSWPEPSVFQEFQALVENEDNYPMLIHCRSANRVGMLWTVYQLEKGVAYNEAIAQGRTIGMKLGWEAQVQTHFLDAKEKSK